MAQITSIKRKTVSFRELMDEYAELDYRAAHLYTIKDGQGELEGVRIPLEMRVQTIDGPALTNYLYVTKAQTLTVTLSNGTKVCGPAKHKLMGNFAVDLPAQARRTDVRYTDPLLAVVGEPLNWDWIPLEALRAGDTIRVETGRRVEVVSVEHSGERLVADICVPGPHSYLLECGVVSHNSLLANELAVNMALGGFKVVVVPLEMSEDEMLGRISAKVCGVDSTRIITKQLATGEKKMVQEKMETFMKKVNKRGGCLTIFKPSGDISIEETYAALNSIEADVTIVDYISLLAGVDGDEAWQKLGAIARTAKVNAEATQRVNVLLTQVNDDGSIRYARSISEHSNNSWIWVTPLEERSKQVGVVKVQQVKARNSRSFPFEIGLEWAHMRVVKVSGEEESLATAPKKNLTDL